MSSQGGWGAVSPGRRIVRFGVFEFDLRLQQLHRKGYQVKLQQQPAMLLAYLLERSGRLVTREELRLAIWPTGTYVEFDFSLNSAISRLRRVLGDSASNPRFIATVPKQGYRFIAPIELVLPEPESSPESEAGPEPVPPVAVGALAEDSPAVFPARSGLSRFWKGVAICAFLLMTVTGIAILKWPRFGVAAPEGLLKYSLSLPPAHRVETVSISPQGDQLVYQAKVGGARRLYRRFLDEEQSRLIAGGEGGEQPFFSPDGKEVGFYSRNSLRITGAAGTRELAAISPEFDLRTAFWADDGFVYFTNQIAGQPPGIFKVSARGGAPSLVLQSKATDKGTTFVFPQQLLRGAMPGLLYSTNSGPLSRSLEWITLDGKKRESMTLNSIRRGGASPAGTVVERGMGGQVLPTGHLLYYWSGSLWAAPFDETGRRLSGSAIEILRGVTANHWRGPSASLSRNGTLAYLKPPEIRRRLLWVNRHGEETALPLPPAGYEQAEVSPDGTKLAVARRDGSDRWSLWIYHLATGSWTQLLETTVPKPRAVWSPDSQSVVAGRVDGKSEYVNLYRIRLDSPQSAERLAEQPDAGQFPLSWSAKANAILFVEGVHPATQSDILVLPLDGDRRARTLVATSGVDRGPAFSPDGKWFAYASEQQNGLQILVDRFPPGNGTAHAVPDGGGQDPLWSHDGKQLYFLGPSAQLMESAIDRQGVPGAAHTVFSGDNFTLTEDWWTRGYSLAPDGRFLVIREAPAAEATLSQIHIIVNWFQELRRQVPVQ